jgi:hypothetical protein
MAQSSCIVQVSVLEEFEGEGPTRDTEMLFLIILLIFVCERVVLFALFEELKFIDLVDLASKSRINLQEVTTRDTSWHQGD